MKKKALLKTEKKAIKKMDKKQLSIGKKTELEHGTVSPATNITNNNKTKTKKIAQAHLLEDPKYYTHLKKMEKKYKKGK